MTNSYACGILIQSEDGKLTASGHENGGIYIFNNELGRLLHSLIGNSHQKITAYQSAEIQLKG